MATDSYQRKIIKERDGNKCFLCSRKTRLEVHHIEEQRNGGDEFYHNLITLCRRCHLLFGNHNKLYLNNEKFLEYTKSFEVPDNWNNIGGNRDRQVLIRITKETKDKIADLAARKGLAQVTVLEYLLKGKINLNELKNYDS